MKKPYLKNIHLFLRLSAILLIAFTIVIIHSCRKDIQNKKQQNPVNSGTISVDIAALKSIYEKTVNNQEPKILGTAGQGRLNLIRTLDVDCGIHIRFKNGRIAALLRNSI